MRSRRAIPKSIVFRTQSDFPNTEAEVTNIACTETWTPPFSVYSNHQPQDNQARAAGDSSAEAVSPPDFFVWKKSKRIWAALPNAPILPTR
jgi:hypothetical protein